MQPRIKNTRQHIILKKLASVFVLCTFLLSITPKQVLHNISAHHKDQPSKKQGDGLQYSQSGFSCDCNSIVATSPFTETTHEIEVPKLVHVVFYSESLLADLITADQFYFTLRGPPVNA